MLTHDGEMVTADDSALLSCRVPKELKAALGEIAETDFTSVSAVVRQATAAHVSRRQAQLVEARK